MLITPEYRALNVELHDRVPSYGTGGHKWAPTVRMLAGMVQGRSILDYGCGKGTLAQAMEGTEVACYDPAIPEFSARPVPADIVVCTDVLEHVERPQVESVIADIRSLRIRLALVQVSCRVGGKTLADGRPAHVTVRPPEWWAEKLSPCLPLACGPDEFVCLL